MLIASRIAKRLIAVLALAVLAVVLFPNYTEPLWDWGKTVGGALGSDPLPTFDSARGFSSMALLALVVGGLGYNFWRDRRHNALLAEYDYRTGATHLRKKVQELESQSKTLTAERDRLQELYMALNRQHTQALVTAKEYEVRSEFGQKDRDALQALRHQFETLAKEKGHIEGFREAMKVFFANVAEEVEPQKLSLQTGARRNGHDRQSDRAALPGLCD
jgi:hypothetical protein